MNLNRFSHTLCINCIYHIIVNSIPLWMSSGTSYRHMLQESQKISVIDTAMKTSQKTVFYHTQRVIYESYTDYFDPCALFSIWTMYSKLKI
jgi:hypothetical protein